MKILQSGKSMIRTTTVSCPKCGCLFTLDKSDVVNFHGYDAFDCPECELSMVNNQNFQNVNYILVPGPSKNDEA